MEITRGRLDDISRPSSSEQSGSQMSSVSSPHHNDRMCPAAPYELVVLTSDAADNQTQNCFGKAALKSSTSQPSKVQNISEVTEDESENSELQKAFKEMRKLDERLSVEVCKEKEIRRQRKELQAKLWQDFLQNKPEGRRQCADEALNTKLFLALEAHTGPGEKEHFSSVFETEVTDCEHVGDNQCSGENIHHFMENEKRPASLSESFEVGYQDVGDNRYKGSWCEAFKSKNTQKNFIKRNIELVSGEVLLTRAQKQRLAELLRQIDDEEEESGTRGPDSEDTMRAGSVLTGHGYTLESPDLEKLIDIDSKIHLLLPAEEYHLLQSSYTNISQVGWKCDGDRQPGEKVLQDIKERREQELRLQEIQQQLEILECSQEMINESPPLTEEQLRSLLDECELVESCIQGRERNETTSRDLEKDQSSL